jgi:hypothetical protein
MILFIDIFSININMIQPLTVLIRQAAVIVFTDTAINTIL